MHDPIYPVISKVLHSLILFGDLSQTEELSREDLIERVIQDLAFQFESGAKDFARTTMDRAMFKLAGYGLLVLPAAKSAQLPDCSPSAVISMFTVRDTLDMAVAEQFNAKRNCRWDKAGCLTLQQVMKLASLCYQFSGDAEDDTANTEPLLKRLEVVLTYADSIVGAAQQAKVLKAIAELPQETAELFQSQLSAQATNLPDEMKIVSRCFGDLFAAQPSRPTSTTSKEVRALRDAITDSIGDRYLDGFFKRIELKTGAVKSVLRLDVKKRSRMLFQIKDAEFHVSLAEDSGLKPVSSIVHMTHTLPDVPWTKLFLTRPTASFVDIMDQVLWEHTCIINAIDKLHGNHRPSDDQKHWFDSPCGITCA